MKVLVTKLEEYRANEYSMKDAIVNAQKTCDKMVKEAEAKCTQMLIDANNAAAENAKNADSLIAAENDRVEEARQTAFLKIEEIETQLQSCIQALTRIKEANLPIHKPSGAFDYERIEGMSSHISEADAVADEISANLEALVGTTEEIAPKPEARHPVSDTTTKFANLQFGRNYDPENQ